VRFEQDEETPPALLLARQMVMRGDSRDSAAEKLASSVEEPELSQVLDEAYGGSAPARSG
jgi:hypothetical protein